jgi:hypothetical protein
LSGPGRPVDSDGWSGRTGASADRGARSRTRAAGGVARLPRRRPTRSDGHSRLAVAVRIAIPTTAIGGRRSASLRVPPPAPAATTRPDPEGHSRRARLQGRPTSDPGFPAQVGRRGGHHTGGDEYGGTSPSRGACRPERADPCRTSSPGGVPPHEESGRCEHLRRSLPSGWPSCARSRARPRRTPTVEWRPLRPRLERSRSRRRARPVSRTRPITAEQPPQRSNLQLPRWPKLPVDVRPTGPGSHPRERIAAAGVWCHDAKGASPECPDRTGCQCGHYPPASTGALALRDAGLFRPEWASPRLEPPRGGSRPFEFRPRKLDGHGPDARGRCPPP